MGEVNNSGYDYSIVLECPPSVNHSMRPNSKGGRFIKTKVRDDWDARMWKYIRDRIQLRNSGKVFHAHLVIEHNGMDIDNPLKPILDVFTKAEVWRDDRQVKRVVLDIKEQTTPEPRVFVMLRELKEDSHAKTRYKAKASVDELTFIAELECATCNTRAFKMVESGEFVHVPTFYVGNGVHCYCQLCEERARGGGE